MELDDAVGKGGIVLRVGDHDDGGALAVQFAEECHHFAAVLGVEVARRLVGQYYLGVGEHGTCYGHALLLSSGELAGEVVAPVRYGHAVHDGLYAAAAFLGRSAHVEEGEFYVLVHVQLVYEVEALEDEADDALAYVRAVVLLQGAHVAPVEQVGAFGGVVEQADDVEQGGLAAARGAHDGHEFAFPHFEVYLAQGPGLHFFGAEYFLDVLQLDHSLMYVYVCVDVSFLGYYLRVVGAHDAPYVPDHYGRYHGNDYERTCDKQTDG